MKVLRAEISGWTASFRHSLFISGFQPTLPLPPLSTLYGLLSAACGDLIYPDQVPLGYIFHSSGKSVDLETVYEFGKSKFKAKPNVCRREFLVSPRLYLYTPVLELESDLRCPHYPLLLGRSTELATVVRMKVIDLVASDQVDYKNTLLPYPMDQISGQIVALPTHFTASRPRRPQGIRTFCMVTENVSYRGDGWLDTEMGWGVFIHQTDSTTD